MFIYYVRRIKEFLKCLQYSNFDQYLGSNAELLIFVHHAIISVKDFIIMYIHNSAKYDDFLWEEVKVDLRNLRIELWIFLAV